MVLKVKWRVVFTGVFKTGAYSAAHKWVDSHSSLDLKNQVSILENWFSIFKNQESSQEM